MEDTPSNNTQAKQPVQKPTKRLRGTPLFIVIGCAAFIIGFASVAIIMHFVSASRNNVMTDDHYQFPVGDGPSWSDEGKAICTDFVTDGVAPDVPAESGEYRFVLCGMEGVGVKIAQTVLSNGAAVSFAIDGVETERKQVCLGSAGTLSLYADGSLYTIRQDPSINHQKVGGYDGGDYTSSYYAYGVIVTVEKVSAAPTPEEGLSQILYNTYSHRVDSTCRYTPGTGATLSTLNTNDLGYTIISYSKM